MKSVFFPTSKIFAATVITVSFASLFLSSPSFADPSQPFSSLESDHNTNPLSANGSDFNMFSLIHQAKLGPLNWNNEEQDQKLDSAASDYKAKQSKLYQNQTQSPSTTPEGNTNPNR
jgi:hypothetical protein